MNNTLVADIGNTRVKAAIFSSDELVKKITFAPDQLAELEAMIIQYRPSHSLLCSVRGAASGVETLLQQHTIFYQLTHELRVPFFIDYGTPQTLGMDRVAAVAGALYHFPGQASLVIDMGTCVTYDFINKEGHYLGGAISPGLKMRLRAMHDYTQKLPLAELSDAPEEFIGSSTVACLQSGAYFGLLGEINDTVERYEGRFGTLNVLLCGGDTPLFDKHTKKSIFAAPDLVLFGLHKILQLHAT